MDGYILKTDYFNSPWTWITRSLRFLMAILVLYLVDLYELAPGSNFLMAGYVLIGILAVFFLVWPTDELALDEDNLYFIRKSFLQVLSGTTSYKVSNFKSIGMYNISKPAGIFALLVPVFNVHRIEIILNDNTSKSEDVIISKKELKNILLKVKALMRVNAN